jgi:plastocyanin
MVAVLVAGTSAAAPVPVSGTVGPGETIGLTSKGKRVARLKAGVTYRFVIRDRSDEHDFRLAGPGVSRALTSVDFIGSKTVVLKLKKGSYRFFCAPHADDMNGRFAVG